MWWKKEQETENKETWPPTAQSLRELAKNAEDEDFKSELEGIRKFMYWAALRGEFTYNARAGGSYAWAARVHRGSDYNGFHKANCDVDMLEKIGDVLKLDGFETKMYHGETSHLLRISWEEER